MVMRMMTATTCDIRLPRHESRSGTHRRFRRRRRWCIGPIDRGRGRRRRRMIVVVMCHGCTGVHEGPLTVTLLDRHGRSVLTRHTATTRTTRTRQTDHGTKEPSLPAEKRRLTQPRTGSPSYTWTRASTSHRRSSSSWRPTDTDTDPPRNVRGEIVGDVRGSRARTRSRLEGSRLVGIR